MTLAELETLARLALPVTVVVFDDAALSLIAVKQGPAHGGPTAVGFGAIDFAGVAGAVGVPSAVAEDAGRAKAALVRADAAPGPFLLDARIDPGSYAEVMRVARG